MNRRKFHNSESLTGQIKIQSLNTIYNRVTLLKSKNVSRNLLTKQQHENSRINELSHRDQYQSINHKKPRVHQNINDSRATLQYSKKNIQQTDNIKTNFWPSQPLIHIDKQQKTQQQKKVEYQNRLKSKGIVNSFSQNKDAKRQLLNISKTIQTSSNHNRALLMSGHRTRLRLTLDNTQNQGQSSVNPVDTFKSTKKRPETSSYDRNGRRTSFRVLQIPSSKKPRSNITLQQQQIVSKKKGTASLSGSRTSLTLNHQTNIQIYLQQMGHFQSLYTYLSSVLSSIKQGLFQVQKSISLYAQFIQKKHFSFLDNFLSTKQARIQKLIRTTRLHQTLSICYLFLEIAQGLINQNQSYLVNFIGHSLANLLLVMRVYCICQKRKSQPLTEFQMALEQMEVASYGERLTSIDDILFRIQHNNQIITMIHKRLGRHNEKFETCIQNFLKTADRKGYSCSLCAHYIFEYLAMHIHQLQLLQISPSLQIAPQPYLPPPQKQYTLILQPMGILQKSNLPRPFLHQFIKWCSKHFQIIIWSWQLPYNVQGLIQSLSPYVTCCLYRHHCRVENNVFVKDLGRLGRELERVLIVDFDRRIYRGFQGNGVECRWNGKKTDKGLLVLGEVLEEMVQSKTNVKDTLTFYAEELFKIRGY